jgi:oxalate decarboxylase/phosphoglucose isomerase-like protein (cupin superfamily)
MTKQEFQTKYGENPFFETQDILMRLAANLSDMQMYLSDKEMVERMNKLKEYIFDYKTVLRVEELNKIRKNREQQIEMDEFNSHLGRY